MSELKKLGKYEIDKELGRGAMGVVYKGHDPFIDRFVAIKTISRELLETGDGEALLERFKREAQAAGRLNHLNIVDIYDFREDDGIFYIAMEFAEGQELQEFFDNNERFDIATIVKIMTQLLDALNYLHENGVVHRDIKPANILVMADGHIKVTDFGIARIDTSNLTQAGSIMGTPSYMSPEQFTGEQVDRRSDIFSAGVIFYQFLTGEKPFVGNIATIMHKVLKVHPLSPSELNSQVPAIFDAILKKAITKNRENRYQTAKAFMDDINRAVREGDFSTIKIGGNDDHDDSHNADTVCSDNSTDTVFDVDPKIKQTKTGNTGLVLGVVGVLVVLALGVGWWLIQSSPVVVEPEANIVEQRLKDDFMKKSVIVKQPVEIKEIKQSEESKEVLTKLPENIVKKQEVVKIVPVPVISEPVVEPGFIYVKTEPTDAIVFFNGKQQEKHSPYRFKLKPGSYQVKITKSGYFDMETEIEVSSDMTFPFTVGLQKK
ncbi:MAG: serine/threonine protein kinase [Methylococcales bacterium]|jgi:serine/threonine protein kinase|nr:serine/threonine protein kinase [Methylococcales bacterium]MBT7409601.1 serine/threonine protein kinase [Methylococcales bacterium]